MFGAEVIVAVKYKNCCFYDRKLIGFYYRNMDGWFLGIVILELGILLERLSKWLVFLNKMEVNIIWDLLKL